MYQLKRLVYDALSRVVQATDVSLGPRCRLVVIEVAHGEPSRMRVRYRRGHKEDERFWVPVIHLDVLHLKAPSRGVRCPPLMTMVHEMAHFLDFSRGTWVYGDHARNEKVAVGVTRLLYPRLRPCDDNPIYAEAWAWAEENGVEGIRNLLKAR